MSTDGSYRPSHGNRPVAIWYAGARPKNTKDQTQNVAAARLKSRLATVAGTIAPLTSRTAVARTRGVPWVSLVDDHSAASADQASQTATTEVRRTGAAT